MLSTLQNPFLALVTLSFAPSPHLTQSLSPSVLLLSHSLPHLSLSLLPHLISLTPSFPISSLSYSGLRIPPATLRSLPCLHLYCLHYHHQTPPPSPPLHLSRYLLCLLTCLATYPASSPVSLPTQPPHLSRYLPCILTCLVWGGRCLCWRRFTTAALQVKVYSLTTSFKT